VSSPDRIARAQLDGHARYCVHHRVPADVAVAGLREITTRPDLLAEAAGAVAGTVHPSSPERPGRVAAGRLLVAAGADLDALPHWLAVGRSRAERPIGWGREEAWPDDLDALYAELTEGL